MKIYIIMSFQVLASNGYLMRMSSEIKGDQFHYIDMIKNRTRAILE